MADEKETFLVRNAKTPRYETRPIASGATVDAAIARGKYDPSLGQMTGLGEMARVNARKRALRAEEEKRKGKPAKKTPETE